ncbi:hypothetical protein CEXT_38062 [Caerostris extrusa]|uniref:Uncharacterized protein n=1 Tax=Caerostris extrusa TaxID=172846 RepID=A0AAV4SZV3_CAEEX|nr:hypothetical protein CEXT_38062 [Caerostris extrusa]
MLETQLAVAHDWNGTAKDVAQGHYQMRHIDGFQYPNKKLTAKTSYNANGNDNNLKLKNKFQNLSDVNDVDENSGY